MYTHYRKKEGGLCYKVLAFEVMPYHVWEEHSTIDELSKARAERLVIIQHLAGRAYSIPEVQFWQEWEGVEPEDIPPAYEFEAEMLRSKNG
jgi:hypothetical protein